MLEIAPFRGLLYNDEKLTNEAKTLIAPPYDVLNEEEKNYYLNLNQHNILHLDYGKTLISDENKYSWHKRSGEKIKEWIDTSILKRLDKPAIFHVETKCKNSQKGGLIVRNAVIVLMKLEEFSENSNVRPHEKTFSSHKEERLGLMKATSANLSQIFGFFPDNDHQAITMMNKVINEKKPDYNFVDLREMEHSLWINQDEEYIRDFKNILKNRKVYIADGHHRYETALNYHKYLKKQGKNIKSSEYVMIYLCPMSDPGLVIFPTHRLLNTIDISPEEMINRLSPYFEIREKNFNEENEIDLRNNFLKELEQEENSLGLFLNGVNKYYLLKILDSAKKDEILLKEAAELASLDTVILSNLIFMKALDLSEEDMDNPDIISYVSDFNSAIDMVKRKESKAAFIINPTSVEDILKVSEKGLVMPRKSTYFYPKVITGLVMNLIDEKTLPED